MKIVLTKEQIDRLLYQYDDNVVTDGESQGSFSLEELNILFINDKIKFQDNNYFIIDGIEYRTDRNWKPIINLTDIQTNGYYIITYNSGLYSDIKNGTLNFEFIYKNGTISPNRVFILSNEEIRNNNKNLWEKFLNNNIQESLTKTDKGEIERMIKSKYLDFIKDDRLNKIIKDIIKKELGGNKTNKQMKDITKDVLTKLYKTLWVKKSFWLNDLN